MLVIPYRHSRHNSKTMAMHKHFETKHVSRSQEEAKKTAPKDQTSTAPRPKDVLCGKGKAVFEHVGNRRFRFVILMNIEKYHKQMTKAARSAMVKSITDQVLSSGARFLKRSDNTDEQLDDRWFELSREEARAKVSQTMRDAARDGPNGSSRRKAARARKSTNLQPSQDLSMLWSMQASETNSFPLLTAQQTIGAQGLFDKNNHAANPQLIVSPFEKQVEVNSFLPRVPSLSHLQNDATAQSGDQQKYMRQLEAMMLLSANEQLYKQNLSSAQLKRSPVAVLSTAQAANSSCASFPASTINLFGVQRKHSSSSESSILGTHGEF